MTGNSTIQYAVAELSERNRQDLAAGQPVQIVDLGGDQENKTVITLQENLNGLIAELKNLSKKVFIIYWEGSKVPRGAVVDGHTIAWTQNGQVITDGGKFIGVYDRLMEFGGESKKQHQMLVFLFGNYTSQP